MIKNNVQNLKNITVDEFLKLKFNTLKDKNRDVTKLVNSIKKTGFDMPIFIWADNDYVIDGTGRKKAIETLLEQGETIESIPIVEIYAKDLNEAKQKVLQVSSKYGDITNESFIEFADNLDLDYQVFELDFSDNINNKDSQQKDNSRELNVDELNKSEHILSFKFDSEQYFEIINLIANIKNKLGLESNEELLLTILKDYE